MKPHRSELSGINFSNELIYVKLWEMLNIDYNMALMHYNDDPRAMYTQFCQLKNLIGVDGIVNKS